MRKYCYQDTSTFAIRSASKAIERAMEVELKRHVGISLAQSRVIGSLALVKNGMTQTEIAEKMGIETPTLVPIVDKLQSMGLVERRIDPIDRRRNIVLLTSKSAQIWDSIVECAREIQNVSQSGIAANDLTAALTVLRKMNENILEYIEKKDSGLHAKANVLSRRQSKPSAAPALTHSTKHRSTNFGSKV